VFERPFRLSLMCEGKARSIMTLSITIFSTTTHSTKCLFVTLSINDAQHDKTVIMLSVAFIYCYPERLYAECHYAVSHGAQEPALKGSTKVFHWGRLRPCLQFLDYAGKALQGTHTLAYYEHC
jgi:hypothetical protein